MKEFPNSVVSLPQIPHEIVCLSRSQVKSLLGLSDVQLYRDTWVLSELEPTGWDYTKGSRGYGREAFNCLWVFRQLVATAGRSQAISQINQIMEDYKNGNNNRQATGAGA